MSPELSLSPFTPTSQLDWQDGLPRSRQFGDVYFSRTSGLQETRHVFLQHNHLAQRFAALHAGEFFTIAETGFGTGLNFLCAWQLWQQSAPAGARLHFVSLEQYPLDLAEMQQALALWPELAPWTAQLLAQYQALTEGWHRFTFAQGRVSLTLVVGDAVATLPQVVAEVDAWFLDGFAPSKNPQLWSLEVLQHVAHLSKPGGTFATYTCAGEVRRTLAQVGFMVEKVPGHGSKREMLRGVRSDSAVRAQTAAQTYWHNAAARGMLTKPPEEKTALIVGAGLAGASLAHALAQRGWQVTVVDRHAQPAAEASGNAVGVLYARLSHKNSPVAQLIRQGYQHSVRLLRTTDPAATNWHPCGVLQLGFDEDEQERFELCQQRHDFAALGEVVDVQRARALSGVAVEQGGLWLPHGGWVSPPRWCQYWLQHENIRFVGDFDVQQLQALPEGGWQISATGAARPQQLQAQVLILCTASQAQWCEAIAHLPVSALRGQVSQVTATAASAALSAVLCGDGYVSPAHEGSHVFGASFERSRVDSVPSIAEHVQNIEMLQKFAPALTAALGSHLDPEKMQGRAALRASSPDFLPMLGGLRGYSNFYVSLAHGARGLISTPLMAEVLASQIAGEPAPIAAEAIMAVRAGRFYKRNVRKL